MRLPAEPENWGMTMLIWCRWRTCGGGGFTVIPSHLHLCKRWQNTNNQSIRQSSGSTQTTNYHVFSSKWSGFFSAGIHGVPPRSHLWKDLWRLHAGSQKLLFVPELQDVLGEKAFLNPIFSWILSGHHRTRDPKKGRLVYILWCKCFIVREFEG